MDSQLETILDRANHLLFHDTEPDKFVTVFLGKLDPTRQRFRYASAGHSTAYVLDAHGDVREQLKSTTTPLGLFAELEQQTSQSVKLNPQEILVVLTGGVTEATVDEERFFGDKRALEVVRRHRRASSQEIVEKLHAAVHDFLSGHQQNDDLTALVLKVTGK